MPKHALVSWGGWEGHTPERSAHIVREMLEAHAFDVTLEQGVAPFADRDLGRFDLIVPVISMATIERADVKNLAAAVAAGTGLAGFHGTMADSFRNEPDYHFMTGAQWVAHPGDMIDYRVAITAPDDPIMQGIGDFDYRSEQYYLHVDPSVQVLATTTFTGEHFASIDGVVMPVVYKRRHGAGRVFYSSLGHSADEFAVPQMRTIVERGMLWAAR